MSSTVFPPTAVAPFAVNTCRCHAAVSDALALVRASAGTTTQAVETTAAVTVNAEQLDWTGNAASLFRERLCELNREIGLFEERIQSTVHLCLAGTS